MPTTKSTLKKFLKLKSMMLTYTQVSTIKLQELETILDDKNLICQIYTTLLKSAKHSTICDTDITAIIKQLQLQSQENLKVTTEQNKVNKLQQDLDAKVTFHLADMLLNDILLVFVVIILNLILCFFFNMQDRLYTLIAVDIIICIIGICIIQHKFNTNMDSLNHRHREE